MARGNVEIVVGFSESGASEVKASLDGVGESLITTSRNALDLAGTLVDAGKRLFEFAKAGAEAKALADAFTGSLSALKEASAGTVDDTTLQRLGKLGQELGLQQRQIEGVLRKAAQLADSGLGSTAANAEAILRGEAEALRNIGIAIDTTAPRFDGLSEQQKKLQISTELAAQGMEVQIDALDSAATKMAQTESALANLESTAAEAAHTFLESSGALDGIGEGATEGASTIDKLAGAFGFLAGVGADVANFLFPLTEGFELLADVVDGGTEAFERVFGGSVDLRGEIQRLQTQLSTSLTPVISEQATQAANLTTAYINMNKALGDIALSAAVARGSLAGDSFADSAKTANAELTQALADLEATRAEAAAAARQAAAERRAFIGQDVFAQNLTATQGFAFGGAGGAVGTQSGIDSEIDQAIFEVKAEEARELFSALTEGVDVQQMYASAVDRTSAALGRFADHQEDSAKAAESQAKATNMAFGAIRGAGNLFSNILGEGAEISTFWGIFELAESIRAFAPPIVDVQGGIQHGLASAQYFVAAATAKSSGGGGRGGGGGGGAARSQSATGVTGLGRRRFGQDEGGDGKPIIQIMMDRRVLGEATIDGINATDGVTRLAPEKIGRRLGRAGFFGG